ncbi:thiazole tautomerase TenI [Salibacterium salarium]|uniref:Thiazole tautomerase TenI n=1 Tax=Salibacterium salarium TaxID=284579 RepID=A0A3R9PAD9_9BACI|nr:thiamine phosphate synthase [Salibacterium salarium]RSL34936.1 thiazole tautomerase TenI [Salibacterium salarium]
MLHVISTGTQSFQTWLNITTKIAPYVDYLHIREKNWSDEKIMEALEQLKEHHVPADKIIVNNRYTITKSHRVAGIHVPEAKDLSSIPASHGLKGSSVHSIETARKKAQEDADYLFFGHIFETSSKPYSPARGTEYLKQIVEAVSIPVIAIGGITSERVRDCLMQGAEGVAVMSGIYEASDPVAAVQSFQLALKEEAGHE